MELDAKIYIAGINGMVGSAIHRELKRQGYANVFGHSSRDLDLTDEHAVDCMIDQERPDYVFLSAAKVGGIQANNTYPADFIHDNLCIQNNVIHYSHMYDVKKLLFLGSSCIYPKMAPQPIKEEYLLSGKLEPTNDAYAIAKICGLKMCESYNKQYGSNFISVMPTNLYGPNDNYDLNNSHVLPALIRKLYKAKFPHEVDPVYVIDEYPSYADKTYTVWGDGTPLREFLHVDDLADACVFLMNNYGGNEIINVGSGQEVSIKELADLVSKIVGYRGDIVYDKTKPNGTPRKLLDVSKLHALGWKAKTDLETGIKETCIDFCENYHRLRR